MSLWPLQFAHAAAAALLDGTWTAAAMTQRLEQTFGVRRAWMKHLARATRDAFDEPPAWPTLAAWIDEHEPLTFPAREGLVIRRWSLPAPAMAESPWTVPPLATTKELATWLGLDVPNLIALADRRSISRNAEPFRRHYRYTWIPKRSGGRRLLEAPKPRLRTVQRAILDGIVAHIPPHTAAHGFRIGHSVVGCATPHVGHDVVIRVDLAAFFTSIFRARIAAIFRTAGYPEEVAAFLAALTTHATPRDVIQGSEDRIERMRLRTPHLPQGAPSSGALSNLAAYRLDVRVAAFAASLDATYTRYADDLILSGPRSLTRSAPTIVARLGAIAHDEGFTLNFRKTRVMTASDRQQVTGIVVNERPSIARGDLDRLRALLHNCIHTGPAVQNRDQHADFRAHLLGRIAWVASVAPEKGARLRAMFDQIAWP
jgi:hypothetical protein